MPYVAKRWVMRYVTRASDRTAEWIRETRENDCDTNTTIMDLCVRQY